MQPPPGSFVCWTLDKAGVWAAEAERRPHGDAISVLRAAMFNDASLLGGAVLPVNVEPGPNPDLLAACEVAQCGCSIAERDSGHLVGCWMPEMIAALNKAKGTTDGPR